jgi:hypothetical protein
MAKLILLVTFLVQNSVLFVRTKDLHVKISDSISEFNCTQIINDFQVNI